MRQIIIDLIKKTVPKKIDFDVLIPDDEKYGHYSTNVAFRLAKEKKSDPMATAEESKNAFLKKEPFIFEKIEISKPGFINFSFSLDFLHKRLQEILKAGNDFGKKKLSKSKIEKVQVEFISANPTGPLTLANGRGGFFGDVLSNVLQWSGYEVEREYYVNDTGNQIITFGKSILAAAGFLKEEEEFYKGDYIKKWAEKNKKIIEENKNNPLKLGQRAAEDFLKLIKKAVQDKARIRFDRFTSEDKDIHKKDLIQKVLKLFDKEGKVYKKDGAMWLKTTEFGDDKDRVLMTSDHEPTYFLADAGHYLETKERGFDGKINVLGPDHYGYVKRIQSAAKIIGLEKSEVIITQAIRLVRDGKEAKMSKRKGEFVTFEDLIDEVGEDVARFFFLMISVGTHMDFDIGLAKERSRKNPVFYAQYAYVRAKNILEKLGKISKKADLSILNTKEDLNLILNLSRFPEVLEDTSKDYQLHRLTRYAQDLSRVFHDFYEKERVIGEEEKIVNARASLIKAAVIVFQDLFEVLGISAPDKM
ncbi:MAG: arginine--tRNA ligase [Patescibacteria group bacterium]|nr:arginine--tRNA ligase [Patescibacteria group bacterium]